MFSSPSTYKTLLLISSPSLCYTPLPIPSKSSHFATQMGVNIDCVFLCSQDNCSALGFGGDKGAAAVTDGGGRSISWPSSNLYVDLLMGFPLQSEDCVELMVEKEADHLPGVDYAAKLRSGELDLSARMDAIDLICKVHAYYSFGPLSAYLSVNYFDRFLAAYDHPQGNPWMRQLLSLACLSLAAKKEETVVPLSIDLQVGEAKYVFESRTIQRMELLVLSKLNWRMQAVTPFSFIDYFLHKFSDGKTPTKSLILRSMEFILSTIKEFRPSEIAAAVALSALVEAQMADIGMVDTLSNHVNKERVLSCYEMIQEASLAKNRALKNACPSASFVPQSPNGVLDAACLISKSNDITVGSHSNFHPSPPTAKMRKLSRPLIS